MNLLLDTDMHDTCDDIGAMKVMHLLGYDYGLEILAITYSAYDEPGLKCIKAVNDFFGKPEIPIGTNKRLRLDYSYNMRRVAGLFPNEVTRDGTEEACRVLRRALAGNTGVCIVGIGPLFNLRDLLLSKLMTSVL